MNERAADLLDRARRALRTAEIICAEGDYDAAASRSYYAAFYVVSPLLALEGKAFKKHSAVEAALHRDFILTGRFSETVGTDYSALRSFRDTGDYGGPEHVTAEQAAEAVEAARRILVVINQSLPK
ncbi:MAG: HEPN domain-containing protein [Candidatus Brocadiia bacterium]|jgi:uncharacterized protein (UPF0332 family)